MRLNKIFTYLILGVALVSSCTEGEDFIEFDTRYKNESGSAITITGFNRNNQIEYQYILENNDASESCSQQSTLILGPWCLADSLVFRFQNEKGFICKSRATVSNLCFPNEKSPYGTEEGPFFRSFAAKSFEFIITKEDLENAFDLPE